MKVTAFELQLWEKLLLKHKLLSKPQIDASIAAWRAQPATSTVTLAQMFEKQGVKPTHTRQLSEFIKVAHTQAQQQAHQHAAQKQATGNPIPHTQQPAASAPAPAQARHAPAQPKPTPAPAAASNSLSAPIAGITDADLSIEGLDLPADPPAPTPAKPAAAKPIAAQAQSPAPSHSPSGTLQPDKPASPQPAGQAFVPPPGAMAAKKPLKLEDPVLAPKFAGNEDLMPNENENVRWAPSDAEWADELKSDEGPKKSEIEQIDLADEPEDPNKPRPKIFKQDNASEWYGAIGAVLNSAGEKKSDDIPILDFDGTLEDPSANKTPPKTITHSVPSIGKTPPKSPENKKP